jgi:hypothetical protein
MRVPVVVLIDDAERLDLDLAVVLLENLTFRGDGQVLVVVAADPVSDLAKSLRQAVRWRWLGRYTRSTPTRT